MGLKVGAESGRAAKGRGALFCAETAAAAAAALRQGLRGLHCAGAGAGWAARAAKPKRRRGGRFSLGEKGAAPLLLAAPAKEAAGAPGEGAASLLGLLLRESAARRFVRVQKTGFLRLRLHTLASCRQTRFSSPFSAPVRKPFPFRAMEVLVSRCPGDGRRVLLSPTRSLAQGSSGCRLACTRLLPLRGEPEC